MCCAKIFEAGLTVPSPECLSVGRGDILRENCWRRCRTCSHHAVSWGNAHFHSARILADS